MYHPFLDFQQKIKVPTAISIPLCYYNNDIERMQRPKRRTKTEIKTRCSQEDGRNNIILQTDLEESVIRDYTKFIVPDDTLGAS